MKRGRKEKYKDSFVERARNCMKEGYTLQQLAKHLKIEYTTLFHYRRKYPEFDEAIEQGREMADEKIEQAVYNRALGMEITEEEIEMDEEGNVLKRTIKKKMLAPDGATARWWLHNRKPEVWRDKKEIEVTGDLEIKIGFDDDEDEE